MSYSLGAPDRPGFPGTQPALLGIVWPEIGPHIEPVIPQTRIGGKKSRVPPGYGSLGLKFQFFLYVPDPLPYVVVKGPAVYHGGKKQGRFFQSPPPEGLHIRWAGIVFKLAGSRFQFHPYLSPEHLLGA